MSQDSLTTVTIPSITIYESDINKKLKPILALLFIGLAVVLFIHVVCYESISEKYNAILTVWIIPFVLSIFSSILLAVLLNWQNAKIENSRLVMIRSEALVPVFYELSVYFAEIAKCAVEESRQRGEKIYDERHSWQEWVSILYELLNEFDVNDYKIWDRKEKYTNSLNNAAEQVCATIDNFCSKKDTMRLFSIIQREEYSKLLYIRNILSGSNNKCFDDAIYFHESLKASVKYISEALEVFPDFAVLNTVSFGKYGLYFEDCASQKSAQKNVFKTKIVRCKDVIYKKISHCRRYLNLSRKKLKRLFMICIITAKKVWQRCKFVPDSTDSVSELTPGCIKVKPFKIHNDGIFALLGREFVIVLVVLSFIVLLCLVVIMHQSPSVGITKIDFITLLLIPFAVGILSSVPATIIFTRKDLREKNIYLYERRKEAILPIFDALAQFYTEVASIVAFNGDINTTDEREKLFHKISTLETWTSLFSDIQNKRLAKSEEDNAAYRSIKDDMSRLEFSVDVVIGCIEKFEQNVEFYKSEGIVSLEEASSLSKIKRLFMRMRQQYQDPISKCKYICSAFRQIKLCISKVTDLKVIENTEFGVDGISFTFEKLYED